MSLNYIALFGCLVSSYKGSPSGAPRTYLYPPSRVLSGRKRYCVALTTDPKFSCYTLMRGTVVEEFIRGHLGPSANGCSDA